MKLRGRGMGVETEMLQFLMEVLYCSFAKNTIDWKNLLSLDLILPWRGSFRNPCLVIGKMNSSAYTTVQCLVHKSSASNLYPERGFN